jgi:predicted transcriptional regulator of viral defense system
MKLIDSLKRSAPADVFTDLFLKTYIPGTEDRRFSLVKRWTKSGEIIRLKRGVYAFGEYNRKKALNLYQLAQAIYGPSYVSLESALSYHGWIPEAVYTVTSACSKRAAEVSTLVGVFSYTPVKFSNLYAGVNRVKDETGVFLMASPWRALADYVYAYRKNWKSLKQAGESLRIEHDSFMNSDLKALDETLNAAANRRVRVFMENCKKEVAK